MSWLKIIRMMGAPHKRSDEDLFPKWTGIVVIYSYFQIVIFILLRMKARRML